MRVLHVSSEGGENSLAEQKLFMETIQVASTSRCKRNGLIPPLATKGRKELALCPII